MTRLLRTFALVGMTLAFGEVACRRSPQEGEDAPKDATRSIDAGGDGAVTDGSLGEGDAGSTDDPDAEGPAAARARVHTGSALASTRDGKLVIAADEDARVLRV